MTIDSGVQGHAPSVLVRPLTKPAMTVGELIETLKTCPPQTEVLVVDKESFRVFDARYVPELGVVAIKGCPQ